MTPAVRNVLLDALKGILILLVLVGHAIQYGSGAEFLSAQGFYDNLAFRFIYSFHMPLFMAVAGYLSYFSLQRHGAWPYIGRRWLKLFPAMLFADIPLINGISLLSTKRSGLFLLKKKD